MLKIEAFAWFNIMKVYQKMALLCLFSLGYLTIVYKRFQTVRPNENISNQKTTVHQPRNKRNILTDVDGRQGRALEREKEENLSVIDREKLTILIEKLVKRNVEKSLESKNLEGLAKVNQRYLQRLDELEGSIVQQKNELHLLQLKEQRKEHKEEQRNQSEQGGKRQQQQQNYMLTESMLTTHKQVLNKLTKDEITEFYNQERISQMNYGAKTLDLTKDRKLLMALFPGPNERRDRVTDQLRVKLNVTQMKTIYITGSRINNEKKFFNDKCNVNLCRFTNRLDEMKSADVIYTQKSKFVRGNEINRNQVIVSYQLESPANHQSIGVSGINWTATYRRDSVLNTPYERFTTYLSVTELPSIPKQNYAQNKTKMAAWFVSNCGGSNRRMNYVKELQKYIQIDIYGQCGKLKCNRKTVNCFKSLNNDYKFYLAFENSNCKDYASEKLFLNAFSNNIIPIVMGAHPEEYKQISPPNSYIHVDEFASPKQLAEYLTFLDKNDDLYSQYFLWKGTGRFVNTKFMCRLCTMVHLAPLFPMWYSDINKWWKETDTCVNPSNQGGGRVSYSSWNGQPIASKHADHVTYGYDRIV